MPTSVTRVLAATVLLGLLATTGLVLLVTANAADTQRDLQDDVARDVGSRAAGSLAEIESTLVALAAELRRNDADLDEFTAVVHAGELWGTTPGLHSLSFAREYPPPGPTRSDDGGSSLVVERIVPVELGEGVVGVLDLYTEDERRRATTTARDTGDATATRPRELAYGGVGTLYYVPVYDGTPTTLEERRREFLGVAIAVVDPRLLFEGIVGDRPLARLEVTDVGVVDGPDQQPVPVWSSGPADDLLAAADTRTPGGVSGEAELVAGDRVWRIVAAPAGAPRIGAGPLAALAVGLLVTFLAARLVRVESSARERAEFVAARRTDELARANADLRRVDHLRQQFVATVSHELRTPLTVVLGYVQTLQTVGTDDEERTQVFLERAERHGAALLAMIEELLDFGRLERGELVVETQVHDLGDVLPELVEDQRPLLPGVELSVDAEPGTTAAVDLDALRRVIGNLLANAARYAPGSPVEVTARRTGETVLLRVSDRGSGFLAEDLPNVFERFYRGRDISERGTGIGLATVRGIVQAHGGAVDAGNRGGGGAEITVMLPYVAAERAGATTGATSAAEDRSRV